MKITSVKAGERFDNTEFSNEIVDGRALSIYTAYTCPHCTAQIGFQKQDFESGARQRHSNLQPEVARSFDEFAQEHLSDLHDFLDWVCPKCRLAARVYVRYWSGGKHGDHGVILMSVIETTPPNKSPEPTPVGAVSSAIAVSVAVPAWLSFFR